ncbi:histidine-rich glycoprotein-like [Perca fluviatilis]|uniref:histidine-rich glycoprotein-like n=1 Tax=Perca fluviatilis TaxID=8168 RepID=UPI0019657955|nr:histidine-rich glycoprotein-like [Perca fluviatilis]
MKGFHIVALLSSAMLLVSAAPALQLVTCTAESGAAAARLAMHRINENHRHGYKFRLQEIQGNKVEKVDDGCNLELQLNLQETVCHVVNPKHFEDCQIRGEAERAVTANCTVKMSVKNNDANVTKYECDTRQVKTDVDVPVLVPLNSTEGLKSVNEAESKFNQNATNKHHYILKEVGRIRLGSGKDYYAEFALVETQCPMGSRISIEACKPLCPDRAHHAFCKSTYLNATGLQSVECEFYPPSNTTALGPGEQEPVCRHHVGGHPPHAGGGRPPLGCILPPLGGDGNPPHVGHGPPPTGGDGHPSRPCGPPHHGGDGQPPHAGGGRPPLGCILPPLGGGGDPPHVGQGPPPHGGDGHRFRPCGPPHHGGDGHPPRVGGGHGDHHHAGDGHHRPPFGSKHHLHAFHHFHHCRGSDPALHPICSWPRLWSHPSPRGKD